MQRRMHTMHGFGIIMTRQIVSQRKPTKTSDKLCSQPTGARTVRCRSCKTNNTRLIDCNSGCRSVFTRLRLAKARPIVCVCQATFYSATCKHCKCLSGIPGFFSLVEHVSLSGHESSFVRHLDITCSVGSVHRSECGIQEVFLRWKILLCIHGSYWVDGFPQCGLLIGLC